MKRIFITILVAVAAVASAQAKFTPEKPWKHGRLMVSPEGRFFCMEDSTPFFYMADTGWLLPQRTDRDEAAHYLTEAAKAGFNVVQVQVLNGVPSINRYGAKSNIDGWNFANIDDPATYGYWDHLDFIIDTAERNGIYIGMVCIWGGLVKAGLLSEADAVKYGEFLAERYKDKPNIIWIIGGDQPGDLKTEVWDALARTIKAKDPNHLMTYHPRGRYTSAQWFADRDWLDFHMYQSGHRRKGQRRDEKVYSIPDGTEEWCFQFADTTFRHDPRRPVVDGEPSYEAIPKGLHDDWEPRWSDKEIRRYAYWDVFAGCAGHTYGHNAVMQFARPGLNGAYHLDTSRHPWWEAQHDDGYQSMKYLRALLERLPYHTGRPLKSDGFSASADSRIAASAGLGYFLYYDFDSQSFPVNLGDKKQRVWRMDAASGKLKYLGEHAGKYTCRPEKYRDCVFIVVAPGYDYLDPSAKNILDKN